MNWHPNDLVSDADLRGYERTILTQFAQEDWQTRRQKALEDWLFPLLESQGFDPQRLRTRSHPTQVFGSTSSVYTDLTAAAATDEGITLPSVLASASDALYVGFSRPFVGLSVRMGDHVNAVAASLTVKAWADAWLSVVGVNNLATSGGVPFAQGGAITWTPPDQVVARVVNGSDALYWVKVALSAAPTAGTKIGPLLVIGRSRLCAAVTFRTLALIFREAPIAQDGPWLEKAQWYEAEAEAAWNRVRDHIGGEFDTDGDDAISTEEEGQTAAAVSGGGWSFERG